MDNELFKVSTKKAKVMSVIEQLMLPKSTKNSHNLCSHFAQSQPMRCQCH